MKTIKELNDEIHKLKVERDTLLKKEKESKFGDHFNTIITKGDVSDKQLLDFAYFGNPSYIEYELWWKDSPYNCPDKFRYNGFKIELGYTKDDNRWYVWYIKPENDLKFTDEELSKLIPDYDKVIIDLLKQEQEKLDIQMKNVNTRIKKLTQ